jgi:flagellar basal-body rod protein FlgF
MASSLYVSLSGQMATDRRMATIATNVSNMSTPGYRAEEVRFETLLSQAGREDVAFANDGGAYTSLRAGPVTPTGNPLDVAPLGDTWLGMQTPNGIVYTRDGRMTMTPNGELRSVNGYSIVDNGGANIQLDPDGGEVRIASDGTITQGNAQIGTLGLFELQEGSGITRYGNSGVIPSLPAQPVVDFNGRGVRQGFVEGSNVDPVLEMTKLITVQRSFEMAASAVQQSEDMTSETIRQLGPS